jgi:hypothetical protein
MTSACSSCAVLSPRNCSLIYLLAHSTFIGRTGYLVIGNENLRF